MDKLTIAEVQFLIDITEEKMKNTKFNGGADFKTKNTLTHTSAMYFIVQKLEKQLNK